MVWGSEPTQALLVGALWWQFADVLDKQLGPVQVENVQSADYGGKD